MALPSGPAAPRLGSMTDAPPMTSPVEHPALLRFVREAHAALPGRIERVLLYGSRARGDAREGSDWDVAVLLRDGEVDDATHRTLSGIAYRILMQDDVFIQVTPLRPGGLENDTGYAANLRRDAVEIGPRSSAGAAP